MKFMPDDWNSVLSIESPLIELISRGSILYLCILLFMRIMPRRTGGELAVMDLVFVLLIAEGASHALGDYKTVADGIIVISTLMAWNYTLNFLSYHFPLIERLTSAPALQIIRNGRLLRRNLRREYITEEELMEILRIEQIESIDEIRDAFVESEGKITFIKKNKE